LGGGQPREETQLHQLGFAGMLLLQFLQGFIQSEQVITGQWKLGFNLANPQPVCRCLSAAEGYDQLASMLHDMDQ
jgi:hypothetical protein